MATFVTNAGFWPDTYRVVPVGPYLLRVTSALPESKLQRGDLIDLGTLSAGDRYRYATRPVSNQHLLLPIRRDAQRLTVQIEAGSSFDRLFSATTQRKFSLAAAWLGELWLLLFAAVIAWRRPDLVVARLLSCVLCALILGDMFFQTNWTSRWLPLDLCAHEISALAYPLAIALLATYLSRFGRPLSPLRQALTWGAYGVAGCWMVLGTAEIAFALWPAGFFGAYILTTPALDVVADGLNRFAVLVCSIAAIARTRGRDRAAIVLTTASFFPLYVGDALDQFSTSFDLQTRPLFHDISNIALLLVPIGLTYSVIGRRLLDIGFVLNRATIFAGVSLLVFAAFSLLEWALGGWLSTMSRTTNLVVSAFAALALGLSLRPIHGRVERVVDRVFFRKRNEDERALRRFAHEAAYFTDSDVLIRQTQQIVVDHAGASKVTIALDDSAGSYGTFAENDPAIVALRAWRKPVDLHDLDTTMRGEFAYPMVARGRLVGALVVGAKHNDDSYAPDESNAIARIALGVGNALDVLAARPDATNDRFAAAIERLAVGMERMSDRLDRLERLPAE